METTTITIDLPESLKAFVDDQVAACGHSSAAHYICLLLRQAQE